MKYSGTRHPGEGRGPCQAWIPAFAGMTIVTIAFLACGILFAYCVFAQPPAQLANVAAVQKYVDLRANDADWSELTKIVQWPDEPSWDCKWVDSDATVGEPETASTVPVTYNRLGLYCDGYSFTQKQEAVVVRYQLMPGLDGWIVTSPQPDYPDISARTLLRQLAGTQDSRAKELSRILSKLTAGK